MNALRTAGQYIVGFAILAVIIALAGAFAVGKAWVRDNSPDWFYNISSPFLRGEDGLIQVGYDEYECSDLADALVSAAEDGDSAAFLILEDIQANCKRDYRQLRDDVRDAMNEGGIDPSGIDCRLGQDAMLDAISARDPPALFFIAVAFRENCPVEYASFIRDLD